MKTISGAIIGTKTKDGIEIKSIKEYAFERFSERGYGASQVKGVYQKFDPKPGNKPNRNVYESDKVRVVVDIKTQELITVVRLKGRRKRK